MYILYVYIQPATLLKVAILYGRFFAFFKFSNGSKLQKTSDI